MVVYVRIEPKEAQNSRKSIASVKEKFHKIQETAMKFDAVRSEEKRASMGITTRIRAIDSEIANLKSLLPKLETVKAKEGILETKETKYKPAREKPKAKIKEGTKYQEELEKIRKRIAGL